MKYYIEYKDKKEFDEINNYYNARCAFINPNREANTHPPGFIIENNKCIWKYTSNPVPTDAVKITFNEWKTMVANEKSLLLTDNFPDEGAVWFPTNYDAFDKRTFVQKACKARNIQLAEIFDNNVKIYAWNQKGYWGCSYKSDKPFYNFESVLAWVNNKTNNLKLEKGAYVRYLGTKEGLSSGDMWEECFKKPGLKAGDVGYICKMGNCLFEIKDEIRESTNGAFRKEDVELITKEEYEAGLRIPNKKYKFNKNDLIIVTKMWGKKDYNTDGNFKPGEIIQLGGKYWNDRDIAIINNFQNLPFISKKKSEGDAYTGQSNMEFRHATPEEIAYFNRVGLGANINDMKNALPFKIGDKVTILSKPKCWSSSCNGRSGLDEVNYPYTFTVNNIKKCNIGSRHEYIAISDGTYGWTYYEDIFVKAEDDDSWKIAVRTNGEGNNRFYVINYLLSLHKDALNTHIWDGSANNCYYYIYNNKIIEYSPNPPEGYKIINEEAIPDSFKQSKTSYDSTTELKWAVKHSKKVGELINKITTFTNIDYTKWSSYKYLCYPFCVERYSHLSNVIPSNYVEISEEEAVDRLNAIINGTSLIRTISPTTSFDSFTGKTIYPEIQISTKKQSITEQLCKIMEKEPIEIKTDSIFPPKRKSIINKLKF